MGKQVVIIGAGVIGLCTAYYAMRKGHRVTVLERGPATQDGCSFGNAGMIVPSHFVPLAAPGMVALGLKMMWNPESPFYIKPRLDSDLLGWALKFWKSASAEHVARSAPLLRDLHLASRACYEELAALPETDFGLVKKGLVMLCRTQHALDEEARMAEKANAVGVPARVLNARQTAELDPGVRMAVAGSVYFPKDCHLSPNRFMAAMRQRLKEAGARFVWDADVTGVCMAMDRLQHVYTGQGQFEADEFVLCGGAWSSGLVRAFGLRLPMQAGKGYSLTLPTPRQLPQLCSIFTEARLAITPMGRSLRFGGTMEIAGLNEQINLRRVEGIIKSVPQYFPEFTREDFRDIKPWCGLRPCSPDGLPYMGRLRTCPNLSIATGHAMMGLSLGPITGKLMAEILSDEKPALDLTLLAPERHG